MTSALKGSETVDIQVIEKEGIRVLTTAQLSKSYEVDAKIILRNFQRNNDRYEEGKHFFVLKGETLKQFKVSRQNDATLKFASVLYLWTERGAWLLAKSLNSEKAWQAYSLLVDDYYKITSRLKSPEELIKLQNERIKKLEKRVLAITQMVNQQITLNSGEQRRLQKAVGEKVFALEKNPAKRADLFRAIYSKIKIQFNVKSYRDVKQHELQRALNFVEKWNGS